eukprot:5511101-Pyramimonas_sp.AAC.1
MASAGGQRVLAEQLSTDSSSTISSGPPPDTQPVDSAGEKRCRKKVRRQAMLAQAAQEAAQAAAQMKADRDARVAQEAERGRSRTPRPLGKGDTIHDSDAESAEEGAGRRPEELSGNAEDEGSIIWPSHVSSLPDEDVPTEQGTPDAYKGIEAEDIEKALQLSQIDEKAAKEKREEAERMRKAEEEKALAEALATSREEHKNKHGYSPSPPRMNSPGVAST